MKMIKKILYGFLFLYLSQNVLRPESILAQYVTGAKHIAMGQTGVANPSSNWSVFSNAALIPTDENHVSFYGFRYAGIAEITDMAAAFSYQAGIGTLSAAAHRYGFNLFNENRFLIGYKNQLGKFHYGASLSYYHVFQGGIYGSAGAVGLDLGFAAEISNYILFGARATNVNQPAYGDTDEGLPRELTAGISYHILPEVMISTEIVKDVMFPLSFRAGLQFEIIESLFARAGITTQPQTYSFGFGYLANLWEVNFALQQHNPLGLSPALDFGIRF